MSEPTHTGRASRTHAPPTARPSYVEVAAPPAPPAEASNTIVPEGVIDRVVALTASVPSAMSRGARYTGEKLRDVADNTSIFITAVGMFCVLYALARVFTHDLLGWRPEREIVELRSENKRLAGKLYDTEKELAQTRAALLQELSGDGDSTAAEAR